MALIAFVWWERRVAEPMLDVELFKNLRFSAASGAISVAFFALFGFIFLITTYFQFLHGYSPFSTGLRLIPVAIGMGVSSGVGPTLPSALLAQSKESVGAALIGARRLAQSNVHASNLLVTAAHTAFFDGFRVGCLVAAGVALVGALFVVVALPARPAPSVDAELAELIRADRL